MRKFDDTLTLNGIVYDLKLYPNRVIISVIVLNLSGYYYKNNKIK